MYILYICLIDTYAHTLYQEIIIEITKVNYVNMMASG